MESHRRVATITKAAGETHANRPASSPSGDRTTRVYFNHANATRVNTETVLARSLKKQHPNLELSIVDSYDCNLLAFAADGNATCTPIEDAGDEPALLSTKVFLPAARRLDGDGGVLATDIKYGKFMFEWEGHDFIVYLADGRDGTDAFGRTLNFYILSTEEQHAERLLLAVGTWSNKLGDQVWVFDGGYWQTSADLYNSVMKASWDAVILDPAMKDALIQDHLAFFRSRKTYTDLKVPWKRGIIYHGPPGNGKTISIKAMMHTLYSMNPPVPTLYVRTLAGFGGPEYSLQEIFSMARRYAPCYLVFEDLDSIVSDDVRSYFLNEVDGLESNDGIFMIGSTNHLERLDPGISKRPSRFDRKYYFPNPNNAERVSYCHFWQSKLSNNKEIEFPDRLCNAIADVTHGFSFAYMQEAFVAALLAIAGQEDSSVVADGMRELSIDPLHEWVEVTDESSPDDDDLEGLKLWVEIKKQIEILREGLDNDDEEDE